MTTRTASSPVRGIWRARAANGSWQGMIPMLMVMRKDRVTINADDQRCSDIDSKEFSIPGGRSHTIPSHHTPCAMCDHSCLLLSSLPHLADVIFPPPSHPSNRLTGADSPSDGMEDDDNNRASSDMEHREQRRRGRGRSDQKNPNPGKPSGSPLRNNGSSLPTAPLSPLNTRDKKQQQPCSSPSAGFAAFRPSKSVSKYRNSISSNSSRGSMYDEECENHYHRELVMYGSRSVIYLAYAILVHFCLPRDILSSYSAEM